MELADGLSRAEDVGEHIDRLLEWDEPAIWAQLSEGLRIEGHRIVCPKGSTIRAHIHPGRRVDVALWALRKTGRLSAVQKLDLRRCVSVTTVAPLAGLPELTELILEDCTRLRDLDGLERCPRLRRLDLGSDTFTRLQVSQGLRALGKMPQLKRLELTFCRELVHLEGLEQCTALTALDLSRCTALQGLDGVEALAALEFLNLGGCVRIPDLGPLRGATQLSELLLWECELTHLDELQGCKQLQRIDLRDCRSLTRLSGLRGSEELAFLYTYGCEGLPEEFRKVFTTRQACHDALQVLSPSLIERLKRLFF